ncbi:MAG: hypothetical protein MUO54_04350 [Anaerolineales bacterium]|nr:hypothetical protein [Anaerolineales bacterium]
MKAVIERIEYNWWNFHIRVMDESEFIRNLLPRFREIWELKDEALPYLAWSLLGFPFGIILGILSLVAQ